MVTTSLSAMALLVALLGAWRAFSLSRAPGTAAPPAYDDRQLRHELEELERQTAALRADYVQWQGDINLAVAEGIKHVERAENRIKATIRRAREELEEGGISSPGLDAEALELFGRDEGGGGSRGMQPVPAHVDRDLDDLSAFPGAWHPEHIRALRGE